LSSILHYVWRHIFRRFTRFLESQAKKRHRMESISSNSFSSVYRIGCSIGIGATSQVYKAEEKRSKKKLALKIIYPHFFRDHEDLVQAEIEVLSNFRHNNIVRLVDAHCHKDVVMLVLDRALLSLDAFSATYKLPTIRIKSIMMQCLEGLRYMHGLGYVHNDVKMGNILIGANGTIKLTDFGNCSLISDAQEGKVRRRGTLEYLAPEIFIHKRWSDKRDIWSLGLTCFRLVTGNLPFKILDNDLPSFVMGLTLLYKTKTYDWDSFQNQYKNLKDDLVLFLQHLLHPVPERRASAEECLDMAWLGVSLDRVKDRHWFKKRAVHKLTK